MGQAQINVRTRACSRASIARTKQAALTHNVRGKELMYRLSSLLLINIVGHTSLADQSIICKVSNRRDTHLPFRQSTSLLGEPGSPSIVVHTADTMLWFVTEYSDVSRTRNGGIPQLLPLLAQNVYFYAPTNTNHL